MVFWGLRTDLGGGTDGASVNIGDHSGLKTQCSRLCSGFIGLGPLHIVWNWLVKCVRQPPSHQQLRYCSVFFTSVREVT